MTRSPKSLFRLAILALLLGICAPGVIGATAQDAPVELRIHQIVYPDVVDPQKSSYANELAILQLAYEGLTRLDANQETVPAAAESWEYNDDATRITFHLREGLLYSDGSPITAENFRYAIERTCDPFTAGEYQSLLFEIVGCAEFAGLNVDENGEAREYTPEEHEAARAELGVTTLDDLTLQIDLTNPAPYYHTVAYTWPFYPVKKEIVDSDPDNWWKTAENHIGNGPFTISGIAEEQEWSFTANENYWQGRPTLDAIRYVYVDDAAVALEAYRAGDLDIVSLEPTQIPEVQNDPELADQFLQYPTAGTYVMQMNLNLEPFNDPKVRQAFAYALDRVTLCEIVREGDCTAALSWIPPGTPGFIETEKYAYDPEAAVQALAESSYGGPENLPPIGFFYNGDRSGATERAEWLAGQYRDILGVEVTLEPTDGTSLIALTKDNTSFPQVVFWGGWAQDYPDPQNWLSVYWTCDATFADRVGYCNEEFDRLTQLGDTTVDQEERLDYYKQANEILVDDQPGPFAFNPLDTFVVSPAVTGFTPTPSDSEWPGQSASLMTITKSS